MDNNAFTYDYSPSVLPEKEARASKEILCDFVKSYSHAKGSATDEEWLSLELAKHLPEYSQEDIHKMSREIVDSLRITEEKKKSQEKAMAAGRSKESWLASSLEQSASAMSAKGSAGYLNELDDAVRRSNSEMLGTITTEAGFVNQNPHLDGFIAEQYHVNSYNLNAQANSIPFRAEVLKPAPGETYTKNSVDIAIKDASGKIINKYQAKYGATSDATIQLIKNGDYRGQQLLVPEEQVEAVQKAFPNRKVSSTIGNEKVHSTPLSKAEAKKLQENAQANQTLDVSWNEYAVKDIAFGIAKNAAYSTLQGAAIGVGMNLVSKVWNDESIDGEELVETALTTGADFGIKTALAGGLKVVSEKGILSVLPKGTSGNVFANIAFVAVENAKILKKVAFGDLTVHDGIEAMQQTTGACLAGLFASTKGAAIGATVGAVFGVPGVAIGGFVGGTIGYMAGSKIGKEVVKGAQKVCAKAKEAIKEVATKAKKGITNVMSTLRRAFSF